MVTSIMGLTNQQALDRTRRSPNDPLGWKSLSAHRLEAGELADARDALARARAIAPQDPEVMRVMADIEQRSGNSQEAETWLRSSLAIEPSHKKARSKLAEVLYSQNKTEETIALLADATDLDAAALCMLGLSYLDQTDYQKAEQALKALVTLEPTHYSGWNNLGTVYRELCRLDEAEAAYRKAASLPNADSVAASNRLTILHYNPHVSAEAIQQACMEWGAQFTPKQRRPRPVPDDLAPDKQLRIGMLSDGLRSHPVGLMTVSAFEALASLGFELYAYSSSPTVDYVTQRFMQIVKKWHKTRHLSDAELDKLIRDDGIDILIDMSGHNAGTRMRVMAMEPAPLIVKWVGGLINTTGVAAIDYLISDHVESPLGSDDAYSENLIRLPDDYICFTPPPYAPPVSALPATSKGYVTFGCFNNPTKINEPLLEQWAAILKAVPDSRLFLKGGAFGHEAACRRVLDTLTAHGVAAERVRLEGKSNHLQLLSAYNDVDVALDPWPYSGGLTTCEAMLMGVPVITLPGPTFAGRHSATHLINAGMPELVVPGWEEYRARAVDLVSDLKSLSTIRSHLRNILLESPVCDSERFARNLSNALRGIWQRHCTGAPPAAVVLTADGKPWFEDQDAPSTLHHPPLASTDRFEFTFSGRIMTVDNGGQLISKAAFSTLNQLNVLSTLVLDPADKLKNQAALGAMSQVQRLTHLTLGKGGSTTLHACLDNTLSGTLEPLPSEEQSLAHLSQGAKVLARIPIPTVRLDRIEGLSQIDWLVLDDANDNASVLEGAGHLLRSTLLVQAKIGFARLYRNQPSLSDIEKPLNQAGLQLLRLNHLQHASTCTPCEGLRPHDGAQLQHADALFIPSDNRLRAMDHNQRLKLAFLLHAAYNLPDSVYSVLRHSDEGIARNYLKEHGWINNIASAADRTPATLSRSHGEYGFAYHQALCIAIERLTDAVEQTLPDAYAWRGINLRYAVERDLYFLGMRSEPLFLSYLHAIGQLDVAPTLVTQQEIRLAPYFYEKSHPQFKVAEPTTWTSASVGKPVIAYGKHAESKKRPDVLAAIIHPKFALYLDPILGGMPEHQCIYLSISSTAAEAWLGEHDRAFIAIQTSRQTAKHEKCSTALSEHSNLIHLANSLLDTLQNVRPRCVLVAEGNAPQDIITLESAKLLGIPCYCVQQGWAPYVHTGFRNMSYSGMFVWGKRFADMLRPWNPEQIFHVSGSHVLPYSSAPKEKTPCFGFFLQWAGSPLLNVEAHLDFINLLVWFTQAHPSTQVLVRPHPGHPLPPAIEQLLKKLPNAHVSDPYETTLADTLQQTTVVIGISSTVLLEAMHMDSVPLVCSIGPIKKYPIDLVELGIGFEVFSVEEARKTLADLVRNPSLLAPLRERQRQLAPEFFSDQDAIQAICAHLRYDENSCTSKD